MSYFRSWSNIPSHLITTDTFSLSSWATFYRTWNVTWWNIGPLWTPFTAPSSCSTIALGDSSVVIDGENLEQTVYYACKDFITIRQDLSAGCVPSPSASDILSVQNLPADPSRGAQGGFHSPGLACPSAWQTMHSYTIPSDITSPANSAQLPSWATYLLRTGGTHAICCPSGWEFNPEAFHINYYHNFYPLVCTSTVTTATSGNWCDVCSKTTSDGTTFCPTSTPYQWVPSKTLTTLRHSINAIYLIHHTKDLGGPPPSSSGKTKLIIAIVAPVLVLAVAIYYIVVALRRHKRRQRREVTETSYRTRKYDQDLEDIDRSSPVDPELEGTIRHELEQIVRPGGAELSDDHGLREVESITRSPELEDTGKLELGYSTRAPNEVPLPLQPAPSGSVNRTAQSSYNNEPYERYPTVMGSPENANVSVLSNMSDRMTSLHGESRLLDEQIRRLQMEELLEQKRRIDDEISALRAL